MSMHVGKYMWIERERDIYMYIYIYVYIYISKDCCGL